MSEENLLDELLSAAVNELEEKSKSTKRLTVTNIFDKETNITDGCIKEKSKDVNNTNINKSSVIHTGDTDSSDDEENKYYEERKYNQYGREIKHLLQPETSCSRNSSSKPSSSWTAPSKTQELKGNATKPAAVQSSVYTDPVFRLRVVNPLVSFTTLQERMIGREAISFSNIKKFVSGNITDKNWVIAGVIVNKSSVKTSQKGNQFLIWTLSDLKDDIKTVSLFLFGSAYKQLWKTATSTVVGILNPSVLNKKDGSKDEACLSVDNVQKVMIIGQSKDFGICKSVKKNGEQCTAIVNINRCEYCLYHIKQEYQKCSQRSELQSNFTGKGLTALRNKVLVKNEVFYAGKLYTAIPAKRNRKLEQKDQGRLQSLSGSVVNSIKNVSKKTQPKKNQAAANLEVSHRQRLRDLALLEKLGGNDRKTNFNASHSSEVTLESSRSTAISVISKLKSKSVEILQSNEETTKVKSSSQNDDDTEKNKLPTLNTPLLSGCKQKVIDLSVTISPQLVNKAKLNALKYIQQNGPLKKNDPNSVKQSPSTTKKRTIESIENSPKKRKIENEFTSDRFKKMMEITSKHMDLLDKRDDEEQEKYFDKMEKKEKMEEKMINTFKVPCKAVRCLKCKYTHFSASQLCKDERHPLKVFDAVKRFYKCGDCGNRTQCLEIVPVHPCKNCGSEKWEKTGMMKEKTATSTPSLSIRGGEQTFINSVVTDTNINLLVPDES